MTDVLAIDEGFDAALQALRAGGLVALPTETVYGLAADAANRDAVASIFDAKGRPSFNPLIAHVSGIDMAETVGLFDDISRMLADAFWPGPLTLVVPINSDANIAAGVTAGLSTIALRHPRGVMAELAGQLGNPIAAPSANSSGKISPTTAQHVADDLKDAVSVLLDGGACDVGLESTIVRCDGGNVFLLREGGVSREQIEAVLGQSIAAISEPSKIEAPGQLLAHYAPSLPLRLNAISVRDGEAWLGFGDTSSDAAHQLNLSPSSDLTEAAHNLFAMMKQLEASGAQAIAVAPIPLDGLGAALNDRLKRAAHGNSVDD